MMIGGHWVLLQSVAWAGMFVGYAQKADFSTALARTFDGRSPCALCKMVKAGKESEQKREAAQRPIKLELGLNLLENAAHWLSADVSAQNTPYFATGDSRREPPPLPPPRIA